MQVHPQVQWVHYAQVAPGVYQCVCQQCGARSGNASGQQADAFARTHAHKPAQPTHYGLGDLIAKATGAVGIQPCTPCEARKQAANRLLPRLWRR